jgi:hypothetical protein
MQQVYLATQLHGATSVAVILAGTGIVLSPFIANFISRARRRVLRNLGTPGSAQVLSLTKKLRFLTGFSWELGLRVQIPGRQPYDLTYRGTFAQSIGLLSSQIEGLAAYQPGETVEVRVDPKKPNRIAIDDNRAYRIWWRE